MIALIDLDNDDCPPSLLRRIFSEEINEQFLLRIAVSEAEAWLMSDRAGFARFLGIPVDEMPSITMMDNRNPANVELLFPCKPSLYMMRELASCSSNHELRIQLQPKIGAKKGPEYNVAIGAFIRNHWNIQGAMQNSYSLRKAVQRIREFSVQ